MKDDSLLRYILAGIVVILLIGVGADYFHTAHAAEIIIAALAAITLLTEAISKKILGSNQLDHRTKNQQIAGATADQSTVDSPIDSTRKHKAVRHHGKGYEQTSNL
jgi:hypothetical protein